MRFGLDVRGVSVEVFTGPTIHVWTQKDPEKYYPELNRSHQSVESWNLNKQSWEMSDLNLTGRRRPDQHWYHIQVLMMSSGLFQIGVELQNFNRMHLGSSERYSVMHHGTTIVSWPRPKCFCCLSLTTCRTRDVNPGFQSLSSVPWPPNSPRT